MDRRAAVAHVLSTAELMGATLDVLAEPIEAAKDDVAMPTVAEFLERVTEVESSKAMWDNRKGLHHDFVAHFGDRPLDAVRPGDIETLLCCGAESTVAPLERDEGGLDHFVVATLSEDASIALAAAAHEVPSGAVVRLGHARAELAGPRHSP